MDTHNIIQWNCRSAISNKNDLIYLINNHNPYLVCLSETWLKPSFSFKFRGYNTVRQDRFDGYGGVAILIKKNIPFIAVPISVPVNNDNFSIVAVSVNNICYISVYIPHPSSLILNKINTILSTMPKPLVVLGDFNCHHESWGSFRTNSYGEQLLEILDSNNLCILNSGVPTRRTRPSEGNSVVDLFVCSPHLAPTFSCSVLPSTFGSDHFPIIISSFTSNHTVTTNNNHSYKRYKLKYVTDEMWQKFSEKIDENLSNIPLTHDTNVQSEILTETIINTANLMFPSISRSRYTPCPPWWDSECREALKNRKRAEKTYRNNMSEKNYDHVINIMKETKKLFKKKKRESWQKFCHSISPNTSPSEVWLNIKKFRSAFNDSPSTFIPSTIINNFLNHLAPLTVNENFDVQKNGEEVTSELSSPFSIDELKNILYNTKDTAPGNDGIVYSFISHLSNSSLSYFLYIINSIIDSGKIPPSWKSQIVLPILKPNKDPFEVSSYRPIALSSVLIKIIEHLIKNRLEWYLESNNILASSQYGFRKGKSTLDNLSLLTTDIRIAFTLNKSLLSVFLDLTSAYDSVLLSILQEKLLKLKIPSKIVKFIINMLYDRSISVTVDNETHSRLLSKGLPQGSVLSPLLYNIYTHDIENFVDKNINILQYADDLVLYITDKNIENASVAMNLTLTKLQKWLDINGLQISPSKSTTILFTRQQSPPRPLILLDNKHIPYKDNTKFLGMLIDSKLSGSLHCNYITNKCEKLINIIRCLAGIWWGAHPYYLKLIYNAIIRSILDYGTFTLEPCNKSGLKKLDKVQTKCLRIICGAMKSSPINALQIECCDPPLHLRRQFISDQYVFRCIQFLDHPLIKKLQLFSQLIDISPYWLHKPTPCLVASYRKYLSLSAPTFRSPVLPIFTCNYKSLITKPQIHLNLGIQKYDKNANSLFNSVVNEKFSNYHQIFCDASKHDNSHVGVGTFHLQYKIVQKVKLPPENTIFSGECLGVYKALEYVLLFKLSKAIVFTDSLSTLQALNNSSYKKIQHPLIYDIMKLLNRCRENQYDVHLCWIPSHAGIYGNCKADELANDAILKGDVFPYLIYCPDLKSLSKHSLLVSWQETWVNSGKQKGSYYFKIQPIITQKPWFFSIKLDRKSSSILSRLRLGHTCTPYHLAKLKIIEDPWCICGEDVADANHIFFSCSKFDHSSLFESIIALKVPLPISIPFLLFNKSYEIYKLLSIFALNNNISM